MSSYISSPFELEERRLQGIVNKCCEALDAALAHVMEQEKLIRQNAEKDKRKNELYLVSQSEAAEEYKRNVQIRNVEKERKKRYLGKTLQDIQLELNVFQKEYCGLEAIMERQKQLWFLLESEAGELDELEESIAAHAEAAERKIRQMSEEKQGKIVFSVDTMVIKQRNKGVSLQVNEFPDAGKTVRRKPLDIFIHKLEAAVKSQYSSRFPSLLQLNKDFDLQPDYAKAAFAVNNMQKLDALLKQLQAAEDNDRAAGERYEKIVLRYKALCNLMHEAVDERLIKEEGSSRKLLRISDDLFRKYQEQQKHAYVAAAVSEVMGRHGISFQDGYSFDNSRIMHFSMDNATVDVSGTENNLLIMEVAGEYHGEAPTMNERRKSVSSAQRLCSLLQPVAAELKDEYGIIFGSIFTEPPCEETIAMRKAGGKTEDKKYWEGKKQVSDSV